MKLGRLADGPTTFWALVDDDETWVRPIRGGIGEWARPLSTTWDTGVLDFGIPRPLDSLTILAPAEETSKVVCLGATYARHVAGLGITPTPHPAGFWKPFDALIGAYDDIEYPAISEALDFEVEFVFVMAGPVDRTAPAGSVLGYTVGNDTSLRDLQFGGSVTGMDMFSAKSQVRATPLGPWIVTADEFGPGLPDLSLTLTVNGERRQSARTSDMSFSLDTLVTWADERTPLRAGDVVFTGTPDGVGHEDGRYLAPGDLVEISIEHLGAQRNRVGARPPAVTR
ncbi:MULTISPECIES: fumarylacetoacetate hydrolase family protein [Nocardia]|uniref:fumarylacetoacetate hydrolase family protein n=1 Tax=Nocardia TaxID=1817 RepID=UPI000D69988A|nr:MULTISPECIES: fumarylacetoacetate hydrolase family protein [Nocardia]